MRVSHSDQETSAERHRYHLPMCLPRQPIPPPFHARRKLKPFVTKQLLLISAPAACCCQEISDGDNRGKCSALSRPRPVPYCVQLLVSDLRSCSCLGHRRAGDAGSPPRPGAGQRPQSVADSVQCHCDPGVQPAAGLSASAQSPEGPLVSLLLSPVSQSLSTRQDYSLLSSLHRYRLLRVARACLWSLSPAPCQCPAFASFSTKTPSSAGFKPPSLRPFRNLGNNNAEEKGRESLCRKSVLNSQLHRVQRLRSTTQWLRPELIVIFAKTGQSLHSSSSF